MYLKAVVGDGFSGADLGAFAVLWYTVAEYHTLHYHFAGFGTGIDYVGRLEQRHERNEILLSAELKINCFFHICNRANRHY